jgi:acetoin utilization deacetylase AcuC-like enzyme
MILFEPSLSENYHDYGIMLPISPSRAGKIAAALGTLKPVPVILNIAGALRLLDIPAAAPEKPSAAHAPDAGTVPVVITREDLERVHSRRFIAALYGEDAGEGLSGLEKALLEAYELIDSQGHPHRYEPEKAVKPLTALFNSILAQAGGTYLACRLALRDTPGPGFCYWLGGGMHHARYKGPAGFCLINDIMIAAARIRAEKRASLVWIVDLDAHKGCGTAELIRFARGKKDPGGILNLSIHMASGWPLDAEGLRNARPERAPLIPADVEIPIESGEESRYISELEKGLFKLETLSASRRPELAIVVDGADPYEHDGLPSSGLLKLSLEQCVQRDLTVFRYFMDRGIPSAWIMAGGYGERAWEPPGHFLRTVLGPETTTC